MAAAAMASGAVALPVAGGAAGASVDTMATGIATATGFGVVTDAVTCCAEAGLSVVAVLSEDGLSLVFVLPSFESADFVLGGWVVAAVFASALAAALASEACWALALRSSEAF